MAWGKKKKAKRDEGLADAGANTAVAAEEESGLGFLDSEEFTDFAEPVETAPQVDWPAAAEVAEPLDFHKEVAPGEASIGQSLAITGELSGDEDVTIDGKIEGKISVRDHRVTIAEHGHIEAEIHARSVVIHGEVTGDVHADERVELTSTASLTGDISAPKVVLAEGASFQGKVDMATKPETTRAEPTKPKKKPKAKSAPKPGGSKPSEQADEPERTFNSLDDVFGSFDSDDASKEAGKGDTEPSS